MTEDAATELDRLQRELDAVTERQRDFANRRDIALAHHEASHATAAHLIGIRLRVVTIASGQHYGGMTIHAGQVSAPLTPAQEARLAAPLALAFPARLRRLFEQPRHLISLVLRGGDLPGRDELHRHQRPTSPSTPSSKIQDLSGKAMRFPWSSRLGSRW